MHEIDHDNKSTKNIDILSHLQPIIPEKDVFAQNLDLYNNLQAFLEGESHDLSIIIDINSSLEKASDNQMQEFADIFPYDLFFNCLITITEEYALEQALNLISLITNQFSHSFTNCIEKNGDEVLKFFLYQLQSTNKAISAISLHIITQLCYNNTLYLKYFIAHDLLSLLAAVPLNLDYILIISYIYSQNIAKAEMILPFYEDSIKSADTSVVDCTLSYLTKIYLIEQEEIAEAAFSIFIQNAEHVISIMQSDDDLIVHFYAFCATVSGDYSSILESIIKFAFSKLQSINFDSNNDILANADIIRVFTQTFSKFHENISISNDICMLMYRLSDVLSYDAAKSCFVCFLDCVDRNLQFDENVFEKVVKYTSDSMASIHCFRFITDLYSRNPKDEKIFATMQQMADEATCHENSPNPVIREFALEFIDKINEIESSF